MEATVSFPRLSSTQQLPRSPLLSLHASGSAAVSQLLSPPTLSSSSPPLSLPIPGRHPCHSLPGVVIPASTWPGSESLSAQGIPSMHATITSPSTTPSRHPNRHGNSLLTILPVISCARGGSLSANRHPISCRIYLPCPAYGSLSQRGWQGCRGWAR
ncbi:hypothetical protein VTI74DRAFT_5892 [Chaetomium olivicolor]